MPGASAPPPPLPSASCLSGNILPSTASTFLLKVAENEAKKNESRKTLDSPLMLISKGSSRPSTPLAKETVSSPSSPLRDAAQKHVETLGKAPSKGKEEVQRVLQRLKELSEKAAAERSAADKTEEAERGISGLDIAGGVKSADSRPVTSSSLRPSSALSMREITLPRPSSRLGRGSQDPLSASWSGASISDLKGDRAASSRPSSRAATPRTPSQNTSSRLGNDPLRKSLSALISISQGGKAMTPSPPWQPSTKVNAPSLSPSAAVNSPTSDIWINPAAAVVSNQDDMLDNKATMRKSSSPEKDRGRLFSTRKVEEKTGRMNRLDEFEMTRGALFSVFQGLDEHKEGRITRSMLEEAGYQVGMKKEKMDSLFELMDKKGKGFLDVNDWGNRETEKDVTEFSRLYIQTTLGASGKVTESVSRPFDDLSQALTYALGKLAIRETGRVSGRNMSHEKVLETFSFIDKNHSMSIDDKELLDCFSALGVNVTDKVISSALELFDKDGSGSIDYHEFLSVLFPQLS